MFKKYVLPVGVALAVALLATPAAFAADDTRVTVQAGALTITNPLADNFPSVTLGDTAQTVTAALATFTVRDQRGSGAGWRVTAAATQFKEIDSTGPM